MNGAVTDLGQKTIGLRDVMALSLSRWVVVMLSENILLNPVN